MQKKYALNILTFLLLSLTSQIYSNHSAFIPKDKPSRYKNLYDPEGFKGLARRVAIPALVTTGAIFSYMKIRQGSYDKELWLKGIGPIVLGLSLLRPVDINFLRSSNSPTTPHEQYASQLCQWHATPIDQSLNFGKDLKNDNEEEENNPIISTKINSAKALSFFSETQSFSILFDLFINGAQHAQKNPHRYKNYLFKRTTFLYSIYHFLKNILTWGQANKERYNFIDQYQKLDIPRLPTSLEQEEKVAIMVRNLHLLLPLAETPTSSFIEDFTVSDSEPAPNTFIKDLKQLNALLIAKNSQLKFIENNLHLINNNSSNLKDSYYKHNPDNLLERLHYHYGFNVVIDTSYREYATHFEVSLLAAENFLVPKNTDFNELD